MIPPLLFILVFTSEFCQSRASKEKQDDLGRSRDQGRSPQKKHRIKENQRAFGTRYGILRAIQEIPREIEHCKIHHCIVPSLILIYINRIWDLVLTIRDLVLTI